MALTTEQYGILEKFVENIVNDGLLYSYADIRSDLGMAFSDVSAQMLGKEIRKIATKEGYRVTITKCPITVIRIDKIPLVTKILKHKSVVSFLDENNNTIVSFDYQNVGADIRKLIFVKEFTFVSYFSSYITNFNQIPEYVWSYLDVFQAWTDKGLFSVENAGYMVKNIQKLPKGYMNFLQECDLCISRKSLKLFELLEKGYPLSFVKKMMTKENKILPLDTALNINYDIYLKIQKILINTVKDNISFLDHDVIELCYLIKKYGVTMLDCNRSLYKNIAIYRNYEQEIADKKLGKALQKLNFLNGVDFLDYKIVVPQGIADLQAEGKQQHNCVGHFYNDSIMGGVDLIYFLRDRKNPTKSVVTCRYSVRRKTTVEARSKNNRDITELQKDIIAEIDKIINNTL